MVSSQEMLNLREELRIRNEQLVDMQRAQNVVPEASRSVQSLLNRAEREKSVLQTDLDRLRSETNTLHDRWMETSEALRNERDRATNQQEEWQQMRRRLETECISLANQQTSEMSLRRKLNEMDTINRQLENDIIQLQTAYQQLKY